MPRAPGGQPTKDVSLSDIGIVDRVNKTKLKDFSLDSLFDKEEAEAVDYGRNIESPTTANWSRRSLNGDLEATARDSLGAGEMLLRSLKSFAGGGYTHFGRVFSGISETNDIINRQLSEATWWSTRLRSS